MVTLLTISISGQGFDAAGIILNGLDIAPNYIGPLNAIVQTMYSAAAIFAPYTIGILTPNVNITNFGNEQIVDHQYELFLQAYLSEWRVVFWFVFILYSCVAFIFLTWGSAKVQPWNASQKPIQRT